MLTFLLDGKKISLAEESKWLFPEAMLLIMSCDSNTKHAAPIYIH
jgi:hypothetical protein